MCRAHIAIIMDGNGRWAKKRFMPRVAGHKRGVETVREIIKACIERGVLPDPVRLQFGELAPAAGGVSFLMQLFLRALEEEVAKLHENNIRFRVIGDLSRLRSADRRADREGEALTAKNAALTLTIAANYGGRWDILQAMEKCWLLSSRKSAAVSARPIWPPHLALNYGPEPDLFIRTGGEQRISNFLLWQLAYSELYFTDTLWPEFDDAALDAAIGSYRRRERRFGRTSEQLLRYSGSPWCPCGSASNGRCQATISSATCSVRW
jgi:undecaprenyl diphosphate synthase